MAVLWGIVWTAIGSFLPMLAKWLMAAILKDFARSFMFTLIGIRLFDRSIGRLREDPVWSGRWRVTWFVDSPTFNNKNSWEGRIYRCFDTVAAEGIGHTADGRRIPYGFIGKLSRDRTILTGTWFDRRGASSGYHGAYQLRVSAVGERAIGKWIGFSDTDTTVRAGELEWQRLDKADLA